MTDLFARLIGRARGTAAVVRPRVPTAFEAVGDAGEPLAEVHDTVEPAPRPVVHRAHEVEPQPRQREFVPREPVRGDAPAVPHEPPVPQRIEPPAHIETSPTIREIVRTTEPSRDVPPAPTRIPVAVELSSHPPVERLPERETEREAERTSVERTIERIRDESRTTRDAEQPADRELPGTRVEPADIRSAQPDPRPAPQLPPKSTPTPSEPPVVRVTIGRVDVRAVHDAPRERRRPVQQPSRRMDLEEYLRRRNGDA